MISSLSIFKSLIELLNSKLEAGLNAGIPGLNNIKLSAVLPTNADELPIITISFTDIKQEVTGIGNIVCVTRKTDPVDKLNKDDKIVIGARIKAKMTAEIWIEEKDNVLNQIDEVSLLFSNLIEEFKINLRTNGLLQINHICIREIENRRDLPHWTEKNKNAIGRSLEYSVVYEYKTEDNPTDGLIKQVTVEEMRIDSTVISEKMVIP